MTFQLSHGVDGRAKDLFERLCRDGVSAIDELIATRAGEELFLEFKRSADDGHGIVLHPNDRKNLAKAVSGFGNSEGGVIVWGVECKTVAASKHPISEITTFVSRLSDQVSGCTVPPHSGVDSRSILLPKSADGFAVTYIPKSPHCPHQTTGDQRYYMRVGSSFGHVPHAVLAGMFGRRPQPLISISLTPESTGLSYRKSGESGIHVLGASYEVRLHNDGPCTMTGAFVTVNAPLPGPYCEMYCSGRLAEHFLYAKASEASYWTIAKETFQIPPAGSVRLEGLHLNLVPPFENDLTVDVTFGCEGSVVYQGRWGSTSGTLSDLYRRAVDVKEFPMPSAELATLLIGERK